jgi:hypothetical protein
MSDTMTLAQLIDRTRQQVAGSRQAPLNRLAGAITFTDTEIAVAYDPGPIAERTYIAIGDEVAYVWEVDRGGKTLTVSRGQMGTEAQVHADLAVVETGARFPRAQIRNTLQEEIRSWPEDVFQVKAKVLAAASARGGFDLGVRSEDLRFVLEVLRSPRTIYNQGRWTRVGFSYERFMPRTSYPSGTAVFINERIDQAHSLRVVYAVGFEVDDIADEDDVVDDWGLTRSMCDIAPIGAAARLIQSAESLRTDTEALGESRIAAEVPPTYMSQTAAALFRIRDKRLREEAMRLRGRYPMPS